MSDDDDLYGKPETERLQGYEPMAPDPRLPQEEPDDTTHGSDRDSMIKAANELHASRSPEREIVPREYRHIGGEQDGEPVEANKTISLERASDDLKAIRDAEVQAIENAENENLVAAVDDARGVGVDQVQAAQEALERFKAEYNINPQQAEQPDRPPGMDPEVYNALKNPKVAAALQAEVQQAETARQQYATATWQSAQISAASLIASVPEFQGLAPEQYQTALTLIERQSPDRANAIRNHFGRVEQLYHMAQGAKAQQAQLEQQKLQQWANQESAKFDAWAQKPENAQRIKSVMPEAVKLFEF